MLADNQLDDWENDLIMIPQIDGNCSVFAHSSTDSLQMNLS